MAGALRLYQKTMQRKTDLKKATKSLQWQEKIIELNFAQWSALPYLPIHLTSSNSSSCQLLEEQTLLFHEEFAEQGLKNSNPETQRQHRRESSTPFVNTVNQGWTHQRDRQSPLIFWSAASTQQTLWVCHAILLKRKNAWRAKPV